MRINYTFLLFPWLFAVLSCSNDDNFEMVDSEVIQDSSVTEELEESCSLIEMSCSVPFTDSSNYPEVPQLETIVVGGTALDSIQSAISRIDGNGKSLFFPSGTYNIPVLRNAAGTITNRTILSFAAINNLEIYGEPGTILQLDFEQETPSTLEVIRSKQVSLLSIAAAENIYIHDMEMKGNFEFTGTMSDTINFYTEHRNILIRDAKSIYMYNLTLEKAEGDAISITASADSNGDPNYTQDVFVTNVAMNNLNRNGVSLAGGGIINNVFISKSSFGGKIRTQQLDFEPTVNSSTNLNITNVDIWDNKFNLLELSSNSNAQAAISILTTEGVGIQCISIRDNEIKNDIQILRGASRITLDNNTYIPSLVLTNSANTINIVENTFNLNMTSEKAASRDGAGILMVNRNEIAPSQITFLDNVIKPEASALGNNVSKAFLIQNANFVQAASNIIDFSSSTQDSTPNIGFSLNFEFSGGFEAMNFSNFENDFIELSSGNEVQLTGEIEKIMVSETCQ